MATNMNNQDQQPFLEQNAGTYVIPQQRVVVTKQEQDTGMNVNQNQRIYQPRPNVPVGGVTNGPQVVFVSLCDKLYIASTILTAFSCALSFPGVWNTAVSDNRVSRNYEAFAYLFLIFSFFETCFFIMGMVKKAGERTSLLAVMMGLTLWNIICLIIAISTEFESIGLGVYLSVAPACLLTALGTMFIVFLLQIFAAVANNRKDTTSRASFQPLTFSKPVVVDLLIANAVLATIELALATGSLLFLSPIQDVRFSSTWYAGAAFSIIYFFVALFAVIMAIVALSPSEIPTRINLLVSCIFSLFSFIVAFTGWLLQIYGQQVAVIPSQFTMILIGWIVALAAVAIGASAFFILDDGSDYACCGPSPSTRQSHHERNLADIEKSRLDAAHYRSQRNNLENQTANV